jgi:hypothetical protein
MRALIALLLSLFLTLNAANAAIHGVCDAFEHGAEHGLMAKHGDHPGHHEHDFVDSAEVNLPSAEISLSGESDSASPDQPHPDHCHTHPTFSPLNSDLPAPPILPVTAVLSARPTAALVSAILSLPERPPRAFLA